MILPAAFHLMILYLSAPAFSVSWEWSTAIAALALVVAILGHIISGVYFLVRFSNLVAVLDSRLTNLSGDVTAWRAEFRSDMLIIEGKLDHLASTREDVAAQEWRIKEHHTNYRLLDDYTRGRIDHLPYKPRDVDPEPTEEE